MSYTALALLGFTTGSAVALCVCSVLSGFFAARRALAEL